MNNHPRKDDTQDQLRELSPLEVSAILKRHQHHPVVKEMQRRQEVQNVTQKFAKHEARLAKDPRAYSNLVRQQDALSEHVISPSLEIAKLVRAYGTGGQTALRASIKTMFARQKRIRNREKQGPGLPDTKSWSELLGMDARR